MIDIKYEVDFSKGTIILGHFMFPQWPACESAKALLKEHNIQYMYIQADKKLFGKVLPVTNSKTVPQIFMDGEFIGGFPELEKRLEVDDTDSWHSYEYKLY